MSTTSTDGQQAAQKPELGLRMSWVNRYGTDYLIGEPVWFGRGRYGSDAEDVKWRRVTSGYDEPYSDLEGFRVEMILHESNYPSEGIRRSVYPSAEFRDVYKVNLATARSMVRVLDRLERALNKANEVDGYAPTDGHYVARVARALGVKWVIFDASLSPEHAGAEGRQFKPNADTIRSIDTIVDYWKEHGKNVWTVRRDEDRRQAAEWRERQRAQAAAAAAEQAAEATEAA